MAGLFLHPVYDCLMIDDWARPITKLVNENMNYFIYRGCVPIIWKILQHIGFGKLTLVSEAEKNLFKLYLIFLLHTLYFYYLHYYKKFPHFFKQSFGPTIKNFWLPECYIPINQLTMDRQIFMWFSSFDCLINGVFDLDGALASVELSMRTLKCVLKNFKACMLRVRYECLSRMHFK